jgi:cysteinyl-tRNA synthetase
LVNQSKAVITYDVNFTEIVDKMVEIKRESKERFSNLTLKTIFQISKSDFEAIVAILQTKAHSSKEEEASESISGATAFEESLV